MKYCSTDIDVSRPVESQWPEILAVLKTANFHHIGSEEMAEFPLTDCFVATGYGTVRAGGGYRILSDTEAKTTLLAADPEFAHLGLGKMLQTTRLDHLRAIGIRRVTTNPDDPRVARWLQRRFGFKPTGETVAKVADFGRAEADAWISLAVDWND